MATDKDIVEITRKAGYEPKENMGIFVKGESWEVTVVWVLTPSVP